MTLREEMVQAHNTYMQHRGRYQDTKRNEDYAEMVKAHKVFNNKYQQVQRREIDYSAIKGFGVRQ